MCQPLSYQTEEVIDLRLQSSELLSIVGQRPKIKGAKHFGQRISKSRIVVGSFESVLKVHKLCICDYVSCEIKIF